MSKNNRVDIIGDGEERSVEGSEMGASARSISFSMMRTLRMRVHQRRIPIFSQIRALGRAQVFQTSDLNI